MVEIFFIVEFRDGYYVDGRGRDCPPRHARTPSKERAKKYKTLADAHALVKWLGFSQYRIVTLQVATEIISTDGEWINTSECDHNWKDNSDFHEGHFTYVCTKCSQTNIER